MDYAAAVPIISSAQQQKAQGNIWPVYRAVIMLALFAAASCESGDLLRANSGGTYDIRERGTWKFNSRKRDADVVAITALSIQPEAMKYL